MHHVKLLQPFLSKMTGAISMNDPEIEYHLIADYGDWAHLGESKPRDHPQKVFFCRFIAGSNRVELIRKYSLKKRKYVGSTSLDSELSFLMANQALVTSTSMVLDPFCGTGSLLISAAEFGGMVYGSDIDIRVLRGNKYFQHGVKKSNPNYVKMDVLTEEEEILKNTKDHSIYANFRQYGLPRPELVRCDLNNLTWRP